MTRWLSLDEAASRCPFSARTLRDWAKAGRLDASKVGGRWVVTEVALEAALNVNRSGGREGASPEAQPRQSSVAASPRMSRRSDVGSLARLRAITRGEL